MVNFLVRYASKVVIYDHRAFIRLATDVGILPTVPKYHLAKYLEN